MFFEIHFISINIFNDNYTNAHQLILNLFTAKQNKNLNSQSIIILFYFNPTPIH